MSYGVISDALSRFASTKSLVEGRALHLRLKESGHDAGQLLGNLLVRLYGHCGCLQDARLAFGAIRGKNKYSWNILLAAFAQNGQMHEACSALHKMPSRDGFSFTTVLAGMARCCSLSEAERFFAQLPHQCSASWNVMLNAYAQRGDLLAAKGIFDRTPCRDIATWNAIVSAFSQGRRMTEARHVFERMPLHNVPSWNALLSGYAHSGHLAEAVHIFREMPERTIVSTTGMLQVYAQLGQVREAKKIFDRMPQRDVVAWTSMATAYARNGDLLRARETFEEMPVRDSVTYTAVISSYTRNSQIHDAEKAFQDLPYRSVSAWSAMIAAYARAGQSMEALAQFRLMDLDGAFPDSFTFSSVVEACADIPLLTYGRMLHREIVACGYEAHTVVSTSLVHMYARCGLLDQALELFVGMPEQDDISWNAMVAACSQNGQALFAAGLLRFMINHGALPNRVTFLTLLSACSHDGCAEDAWRWFVSMPEYDVCPDMGHYVCMVDVLARVGNLDLALDLIDNMPFVPDSREWRTFLAACFVHGSAEQGQAAATHVLDLSFDDKAAPYILLSNMKRSRT